MPTKRDPSNIEKMKLAVIADIHSNLAALEAVLEVIAQKRPDLVICLGDLVGYNAEPEECIALLQKHADLVVAGNHDADICHESRTLGTNSAARSVQEWTRKVLSEEALSYLRTLPTHRVDPRGFVAAHGCYLSEVYISGYVTSTMLEANLQAILRRSGWPKVAFCGHTHVPLCGWLDSSCIERVPRPSISWPKSAEVVLVNPGSVGQPRDGDPRASFALISLEERSVEIVRVPYDIARTMRSIQKAGLPLSLAERLQHGL